MDPIRFGRGIRALRRRRRWRQVDLGVAARVSRSAVSRVERSHVDQLTLRSVEAIADALGARIDLRLTWTGEALDRLLDADHALLVEQMSGRLRHFGWQGAVEVSFNVFGERGSIDLLGYHEPTRTALVIEVKSVVPDLQAAIVSLDRKASWPCGSPMIEDGRPRLPRDSSFYPQIARPVGGSRSTQRSSEPRFRPDPRR